MLKDFVNQVEQTLEEKRQERNELFRTYAATNKPHVIEKIQRFLPTLYSTYKEEIDNAPPVWLNNGEENSDLGCSGFGASGLLVQGMIIAFYRNSYCTSIVLAEYFGEEKKAQRICECLSSTSIQQIEKQVATAIRRYNGA